MRERWIEIEIGPDDYERGAVAHVFRSSDGDTEPGGGWGPRGGAGPRDRDNPDAWLALARRRLILPRDVRAAGLGWSDATVRPAGWSEGAGHAPGGIVIRWTLP